MFLKFPEWKYLRCKIQDCWRWLTAGRPKPTGLPDDKYFGYQVKENWQRLATRDWINRNPKVIMGITAFSILLFFILVVNQLVSQKSVAVKVPAKEWFYDLNTSELFAAKTNSFPPIKAPSGPLPDGQPAGVRAYVFQYDNESEEFIGFLETLTPEAREQKATSADSTVDGVKEWYRGRLFRRPDEDEWFPADSEEGRVIFQEFFLPNDGKEPPRYCLPK